MLANAFQGNTENYVIYETGIWITISENKSNLKLTGMMLMYPFSYHVKIEIYLEKIEGLIKKLILTQGIREQTVPQTFSIIWVKWSWFTDFMTVTAQF